MIINISVTGETGSGKTRISDIIARALKEEGVETTYFGLDFETTEDLSAHMSTKRESNAEVFERHEVRVNLTELGVASGQKMVLLNEKTLGRLLRLAEDKGSSCSDIASVVEQAMEYTLPRSV